MAGIIITPGTFNPPATPLVSHGAYTWPRTPVMTVKRAPLQFSSRLQVVPEVESGTTLDVNFVSFEMQDGEIKVGVITDSFDSSPSEITTTGVRYVADGTYSKTGFGFSDKQYYLGTDPLFVADTTGINFGSVEIKTSNSYGSAVAVNFGYNLTLVGTGDSATYTIAVGTDYGTLTTASGTIKMGFTGSAVDRYAIIPFTLFRDGIVFDRIIVAIRVRGTITSSEAGPETQPEVSSGLTLADTLYGAEATPGAVAVPTGMALGRYYRESRAVQGTAHYV